MIFPQMPSVAQSIQQVALMEDEMIDALDLSYCVDVDATHVYPLVAGGENVSVSQFNRSQYLSDLIRFYLGANLPLKEFVRGVHEICPLDRLRIFTPQMLQILVAGSSSFTVDDFKQHHIVVPSNSPSRQVLQWFERFLDEISDTDRKLLLTFVTGSSVLPPNGLAGLNPNFMIRRSAEGIDSLPCGRTCFNLLELPEYSSYEQLKTKVLYAITNVQALEFGFA
jgi:E3 ubiquitin-protein ligase HUWE1